MIPMIEIIVFSLPDRIEPMRSHIKGEDMDWLIIRLMKYQFI